MCDTHTGLVLSFGYFLGFDADALGMVSLARQLSACRLVMGFHFFFIRIIIMCKGAYSVRIISCSRDQRDQDFTKALNEIQRGNTGDSG